MFTELSINDIKYKDMRVVESALGKYQPLGSPSEADVILGHSFGTSIHRDSPNGALAQYIHSIEQGQPIVVDRILANAFPRLAQLDVVVEGPASNALGSIGGSWGILIEAKRYMDEEQLTRPLMVAQAFHIGRVALQAKKIGMENIIIPDDLPRVFDADSEQIWTRDLGLWFTRETIGSLVLKYQGRI